MTTSAKIQVSINGGAPASGILTASAGQTVAITPVNTSGWYAARYEIYDYPPGFSAPAGWSTDASGVIFFVPGNPTQAPPTFALPAAGANNWGPFPIRCRVNNNPLQYTGTNALSAGFDPSLVDESTVVTVPSPNLGLTGIFAGENSQRDSMRGWVGSHMAAHRALDTSPAGTGDARKVKGLSVNAALLAGQTYVGNGASIDVAGLKAVHNLATYCTLDGTTDDTAGLNRAIQDAALSGNPIHLPGGKSLAITSSIQIIDDNAHGNVHAIRFIGGRGGASSGTDLTRIIWKGASLSGSAATIASSPSSHLFLITGLTGITTANVGDILDIWGCSNGSNAGHFTILAVPAPGQAIIQNFAQNAAATDANNGAIKWRQRGVAFKVWSRDNVFQDLFVTAAAGSFLGAAFDCTFATGTGAGICTSNTFERVQVSGNWSSGRIAYGWIIGRNVNSDPTAVNASDPNDCENFTFRDCYVQEMDADGVFIPNGTGNAKTHRFFGGTIYACMRGIRVNVGSVQGHGLNFEFNATNFSLMNGGDPSAFYSVFSEASSQLYSRNPVIGLSGAASEVTFDGGEVGAPQASSAVSVNTRTNGMTLAAGQWIVPAATNGYVYMCKESGTAAGSPPTFTTSFGDQVIDGTAILECRAFDGSADYAVIDHNIGGSVICRGLAWGVGPYDTHFTISASSLSDLTLEDCLFPSDTPLKNATPKRARMNHCTALVQTWSTGLTVATGKIVVDTTLNGRRYRALNSGTTGGGACPLTAVTTVGNTVTDNSITWLCEGFAVNNQVDLANQIVGAHTRAVDWNCASIVRGGVATPSSSVTLANGVNAGVNIGGSSYLRVSGPTGAYSISSFTPPSTAPFVDGYQLTVWCSVNQALTVKNEDTVNETTATNRITTRTGADVTIPAQSGGVILGFMYDIATTRWVFCGWG